MDKKINGAQVILKCLKEHEVEHIFGFPGGAVIPLYDALYDQKDSFKHTLTVHEQGAVHAADAYARSTGKTGVCFVTSGPGATNTVTGIATAFIDSVPLLVITGQVPSSLLGKDSFQEVNITKITSSITKKNYIIKNVNDISEIINEAFYITQEGRPGPVLIDVPKDMFVKTTEDVTTAKSNYNNTDKNTKTNIKNIKKLATLINKSQRPVIFAGGGIKISGASNVLYNLATKANIPVTNSLMGLGTFPRDNFLSLGLLGMHGFKSANLAVTNCDLFIALGTRFSDRVTGKTDMFAPNAEIIHIDIDAKEIGKNKNAHHSLKGDVKNIIELLLDNIEDNERKDWINMISHWNTTHCDTEQFNPKNIIKTLNEVFNENVIITTDVGQHQMWTAQNWQFKNPREFLTSGGMGTMGYGLGAAIGAKTANPDKKVIMITGDGSFRMNCHELATVSKYKLPINIILFNNSALGMVRQWQRLFQNERYSETDITNEVDYVMLANAYGINGYRVNNIDSLKNTLSKIVSTNTANLIECIIDKDTGVYPIVPPGMPIDNLILGQSGA